MNSYLSDTVYGIKHPGELIRERRVAHGLSQRELAYRAGTSQSAVARIEAGDEDITWKRLRSLLFAMGDEPILETKRLQSRYDPDDLMRDRAMAPEARLASGVNFNRFATEFAIAAAKARARDAVSA